MLSFFGSNHRLRYVIVVLAMTALFVCNLTSRGFAFHATEFGAAFHHGHVHDHGHDHDDSADPLASGDEASAPHVHVVGFLPPQYALPSRPLQEMPNPGQAREILQDCLTRFERPPKAPSA